MHNRRIRFAAPKIIVLMLALAALLMAVVDMAHADTPGLVIRGDTVNADGSHIIVREGGWLTYTVKLASQPTGDVTVALSPVDESNRKVHVQWTAASNPRIGTTTFTTSNWNTPQTVYVWGQQDDELHNCTLQSCQTAINNETDTITHSASGGGYDNVSASMTAAVEEDDGIGVSAATLSVSEGGSASYSVHLIAQPDENVTVNIAVTGDSDITVSPTTLSFTTSDYHSLRTVTVYAAEDGDSSNGKASVTHTVSADTGGYYDNAGPITLTAIESDNDKSGGLVVTSPEIHKIQKARNGKVVSLPGIARGGTTTFDVRLNTAPTADVPVGVSEVGDALGTISHSPSSLTFTSANWNVEQTVTVTSSNSADGRSGNAILRLGFGHTDDDNYAGQPHVDHRVHETNPPGIVLSDSNVEVAEGGDAASYSVYLAAKPYADVTVTIAEGTTAPNDDGDITVSGSKTLTFTSDNWDMPRAVSLVAAHDDDLLNGVRAIDHSASGGGYDDVTASLTATENDTDTPSIVVSSGVVTVPEGGSATYAVSLSNQPDAAVTVTITDSGDDDISVSPASLTFNATNWNTAQTVTVSAAEDGDDLSGSRTITHSASDTGGFDDAADVVVTASEGDNDARGFIVAPEPGSVSMDEGGTHSYTVKLGTEPTADVTVAIARAAGGDSDITVAPASLTFTSADYSTAQTVTISAAEDNSDYADDTATITHSVTTTDSIYTEQTIGDIAVTAQDNDATLILSADTVTVREYNNATYTLRLTHQPTDEVVVTIAEGTGTNDDTSIRVSSPSNKTLTFNSTNWDTPQTVRLYASGDSDSVNGTRSIAHVASGDAEFVGVAVFLTAVERDSSAAITVRNAADTSNLSSINVTEQGSATYKVKLVAEPASDVTVALTVTNDADVTVSPATLTFTSGNYSTAQTVTVSAASDADLANGSASIAHAASGGGYMGVSRSITAREIDNTGQITLRDAADSADITAISVPEGGNTTYKVKLSHQPTGSVTVRLQLQSTSDGGDGDISASPTWLYFNTSNWNTAKTVTVRAQEDDNDSDRGSRVITHTATGGSYNGATTTTKTLTATELDNEVGITITPASGLTVTEGSTATYTVKLAAAPTQEVTVTITEDTTAPNDDTDITVTTPSNKTLTFTTQNYDTAQTVTVSAGEDADKLDGSRSLTHAATSPDAAYDGLSETVTVTEIENDPAILIDRDTIDVPEGRIATYTVRLSSPPTANVIVTIAGSTTEGNDTDIEVTNPSSKQLTFTPQNYSTPQTVSLHAAYDSPQDKINGSRAIGHTANSSDSNYDYNSGNGLPIAALTANEREADLILTPATLSVPEGGSATYTVALNNIPTNNYVDVSLSVAGDSDITISPSSLRFYQSSWQGAKTVTVRAAQDNDGIHGAATVTHTASLAGYTGTTKTLSVEEADDDAGITLTPNSLTVPENGSATYTVRLGKAPTDDVTVALTAASGDTDITFAPASLTFTTGNYSTAQTITVSAALDADTTDGSKTITHTTTSQDTSYDNLTATLTATEDDITGTINISTISIAVTEGSTATYTVSLSQQPTASVTVALTSIGDSDITFSPSSLTFNGNNYSTAQTVTVSAAEDNDVLPGVLTITHTADSTDVAFDDVTAKISATEDENDKGIVIRDASLAFVNAITVNEGSFQHIFVSPSVDPTGNVTVAVTLTASTGDSDITYNPSSVSFTSTGSKVIQVFAAEDNDNDNGTKTITFTATSTGDTGYNNKTATLTVTENDNEPQLSVSVTATTATMTLSNHTGNWYYKQGSGVSATCEGPVTGTSKTVTGLTKTTQYTFYAFSDSACATQLDSAGVTTATPSLAASNLANTTATITLSGWDASKDGNWYHKKPGGTSTCHGPVSSASADLTSLTAGTSYTWTAYSGKSGSSCTGQIAQTSFTTTGSAPNAQLAAPAPVGSVSASRVSGSIEATWSAVGGATGYDVVYSTDNKASWARAATNRSVNSYTLTSADDSLPYIIGVRAVNAGGESAWTNSNTVPAVPVYTPPPPVQPPAAVGSVSAGRLNGDVVANWSAVSGATGYNIVYSTDGKASWTRAATNHGGNTYTLTGAQYGLSYIIGVQAVNSGGASGWTNSNTVPIVKPPGNIVSVSASRVNDTIEVQWSAADNATGYHVVYSTDHAASWNRAATNHSGTSYTLTSADAALPYIIGIQAVNAAGVSGWKNSNTVN